MSLSWTHKTKNISNNQNMYPHIEQNYFVHFDMRYPVGIEICCTWSTCLCLPALFYNDGGEDGDEVLYGTADGKIGLVQLTRCVFFGPVYSCVFKRGKIVNMNFMKIIQWLTIAQ